MVFDIVFYVFESGINHGILYALILGKIRFSKRTFMANDSNSMFYISYGGRV